MSGSKMAATLGAIALLAPAAVLAQTGPPSQPPATPALRAASSEQQTWQGLPFASLADFENKISIGMSRHDLVRTLGRPEMIMPGRESDQVYHYTYAIADGAELHAVVIVRDNSVFIRRLYASSPTAGTARAN